MSQKKIREKEVIDFENKSKSYKTYNKLKPENKLKSTNILKSENKLKSEQKDLDYDYIGPQPILKYRNISYSIKGNQILHDIDLRFYDGSITAIIGLSGAGKTTLLKALSGYIESGEIYVRKDAICYNKETVLKLSDERNFNKNSSNDHTDNQLEDLESLSKKDSESLGKKDLESLGKKDSESLGKKDLERQDQKNCNSKIKNTDTLDNYVKLSNVEMRKFSSLVPQHEVLPETFTVKEYLKFVLCITNSKYRLSFNDKKMLNKKIEYYLKIFNLNHIADIKIGNNQVGISGGERRRVEILSEILMDRKVLFLDEPTTGLDIHNAMDVIDNLRNISANDHDSNLESYQTDFESHESYDKSYDELHEPYDELHESYDKLDESHESYDKLDESHEPYDKLDDELHESHEPYDKYDEPYDKYDDQKEKKGKCVVLTIHQPAKDILYKLDHLILITSGRIIFHLKVRQLIDFLQFNNFKMSIYTNPAEYLFTDFLQKYEFCKVKKMFVNKVNGRLLLRAFFYKRYVVEHESVESLKNVSVDESSKHESVDESSKDDSVKSVKKTPQLKSKLSRTISEIILLVERTSRTSFSSNEFITRLLQSVVTGVIFGVVFYRFEKKNIDNIISAQNLQQQSVQQQQSVVISYISTVKGFIYSGISNSLFTCAYIGLRSTNDESIFNEIYSFRYSCFYYYITKWLFDALAMLIYPIFFVTLSLILSGINYNFNQYLIYYFIHIIIAIFSLTFGMIFNYQFKNKILSASLMSAILGPMIILSGLMIDYKNMSIFMKCLSYLSFSRYCYHILCKNHFYPMLYKDNSLKNVLSTIDKNHLYEDSNSMPDSIICIFLIIFVTIISVILSFFTFRRRVALFITT
ncbi:ATP-binding Cassette (ABC) Superfamily [Pseudoloma neurophilia]|uniref:ATP-binding Cassette (ABC) Superfamily n=1 Tax=Pseudoloma neurophilia TaxID=146866 RepID=A0A0R0LZW5_9MICR|nr:ATP-binding Cassette (ABC) Superfamily [Pseudoloma neurophilia]